MASTVASYVAVVEAGPYLTSVDIRPNTLCKGGSIKTTLYDPCFRSTTVVQGFPAVHSFCTESPETRRSFLLSGAGSLGWVGAGFLRPHGLLHLPLRSGKSLGSVIIHFLIHSPFSIIGSSNFTIQELIRAPRECRAFADVFLQFTQP